MIYEIKGVEGIRDSLNHIYGTHLTISDVEKIIEWYATADILDEDAHSEIYNFIDTQLPSRGLSNLMEDDHNDMSATLSAIRKEISKGK